MIRERSFPSVLSMLPLKTLAPSLSAPVKTSVSDIHASTAVIDSTELRAFYVLRDEDDLS
jgi:hypothetical protein